MALIAASAAGVYPGRAARRLPAAAWPRVLAWRALLGLAALLPAGCGPSDAEIAAAKAAVGEHAELLRVLPDFRSGLFAVHEIEYVNRAISGSDNKKYAVNIVIIQNDQDPKAPRVLTRTEQLMKRPREFYTRFLCPPRGLVAPFVENFDFEVKLVSRQFNQFYRIPCDYTTKAEPPG